jgi:hypothetical protein
MSESGFQSLAGVARLMQNFERQRFAKCGRLLFKKYFDLSHFEVAFTECFVLLYTFFFAGLGLAVSIS